MFGWLVALGKVNTFDRLQRRCSSWYISPHCFILCKVNGKSLEYIMIHCGFSLEIWDRWCAFTRGKVGIPQSIEEIFSHPNSLLSSRAKSIRLCAVMKSIWSLWLEQNKCIFEDREMDNSQVWEKSKLLGASCIF